MDHVTAFDLAGSGTASHRGMAAALAAAARFAPAADRLRATDGPAPAG